MSSAVSSSVSSAAASGAPAFTVSGDVIHHPITSPMALGEATDDEVTKTGGKQGERGRRRGRGSAEAEAEAAPPTAATANADQEDEDEALVRERHCDRTMAQSAMWSAFGEDATWRRSGPFVQVQRGAWYWADGVETPAK